MNKSVNKKVQINMASEAMFTSKNNEFTGVKLFRQESALRV